MTPTREDVLALARCFFPTVDVSVVMQTLDDYGTQPGEPERERVHLAILGLSQGHRAKLHHFVEAAKRDYRDVLSWSDGGERHARWHANSSQRPRVSVNAVIRHMTKIWNDAVSLKQLGWA
jgi:hypothetical protein